MGKSVKDKKRKKKGSKIKRRLPSEKDEITAVEVTTEETSVEESEPTTSEVEESEPATSEVDEGVDPGDGEAEATPREEGPEMDVFGPPDYALQWANQVLQDALEDCYKLITVSGSIEDSPTIVKLQSSMARFLDRCTYASELLAELTDGSNLGMNRLYLLARLISKSGSNPITVYTYDQRKISTLVRTAFIPADGVVVRRYSRHLKNQEKKGVECMPIDSSQEVVETFIRHLFHCYYLHLIKAGIRVGRCECILTCVGKIKPLVVAYFVNHTIVEFLVLSNLIELIGDRRAAVGYLAGFMVVQLLFQEPGLMLEIFRQNRVMPWERIRTLIRGQLPRHGSMILSQVIRELLSPRWQAYSTGPSGYFRTEWIVEDVIGELPGEIEKGGHMPAIMLARSIFLIPLMKRSSGSVQWDEVLLVTLMRLVDLFEMKELEQKEVAAKWLASLPVTMEALVILVHLWTEENLLANFTSFNRCKTHTGMVGQGMKGVAANRASIEKLVKKRKKTLASSVSESQFSNPLLIRVIAPYLDGESLVKVMLLSPFHFHVIVSDEGLWKTRLTERKGKFETSSLRKFLSSEERQREEEDAKAIVEMVVAKKKPGEYDAYCCARAYVVYVSSKLMLHMNGTLLHLYALLGKVFDKVDEVDAVDDLRCSVLHIFREIVRAKSTLSDVDLAVPVVQQMTGVCTSGKSMVSAWTIIQGAVLCNRSLISALFQVGWIDDVLAQLGKAPPSRLTREEERVLYEVEMTAMACKDEKKKKKKKKKGRVQEEAEVSAEERARKKVEARKEKIERERLALYQVQIQILEFFSNVLSFGSADAGHDEESALVKQAESVVQRLVKRKDYDSLFLVRDLWPDDHGKLFVVWAKLLNRISNLKHTSKLAKDARKNMQYMEYLDSVQVMHEGEYSKLGVVLSKSKKKVASNAKAPPQWDEPKQK